jgi:hypothetical protein
MRQHSLPPIFAQYAGAVNYVRQVAAEEWSSSCPKCGGAPHQDGEFPDRFRWFTKGKPVGWCRRCGHLAWPDAAEGWTPPSPEELERWRKEREQAEEARKRSAERALANLRSSRLWEQYHQQLDAYARDWWQRRGIPDEWQDFWKLGINYEYRTGSIATPSATIPLFDHQWQALNIKHRLLEPPEGVGKYRYEVSGQGQPMFITNPTIPLAGHAIAIEGEIKAAVTYIHMGQRDACIVGLPGKSVSADVVAALARCERVTLVFDPGGERDVLKLAKAIGIGKCRALVTCAKIDDGILAANLTPREIQTLLRGATLLRAFVRN